VLEAYLDELVQRLRARLGERLVAAWQVGSGALGDFDPARSDVDVQALAPRLARAELRALAAELSALECPVRGLEFVLYEDLREARFQLNLNTGPRMDHHEGYDPDAEPRFWFVLDLSIARQHRRALYGELELPELPRPVVLGAIRESLEWWRRHDAAQAILAACRAWAFLETGDWLSKGEAARWAQPRVEGEVRRALAARGGGPAPTEEDVRAVFDRIRV
jgi:hypothetical protein